MNKSLIIIAGILAIIGLAINVTVDRDNIFDMTLSGLWLVTIVLVFLGAFTGRGKTPPVGSQVSGTGTSPATMAARLNED